MKTAGSILIFLLFGAFLFSCRGTEQMISIPENYSSWKRMNNAELNYPIPGHESNYRIIYINDTGLSLKISQDNGQNRYDYPEGTIIAKSVYSGLDPKPDAEPIMVTAMMKNKEHPNARGGWVWIIKNLDSGEQQLIKDPFCYTCHRAANDSHPYADGNPQEEFRDYVFFAKE